MHDWKSRLRPLVEQVGDDPYTEPRPADLACGLVLGVVAEAAIFAGFVSEDGTPRVTRRFGSASRDLDRLAARCLRAAGSIEFCVLDGNTRSGAPFLQDVEAKMDDLPTDIVVATGATRLLSTLGNAAEIAQGISRDGLEDACRDLLDALCELAATYIIFSDHFASLDAELGSRR